jgi:hypothetical protein
MTTWILITLLSTAAIAADGRDPDRMASSVAVERQSAALEACGLFTVEEAGKALSRKFSRTRQSQEQSGTTCRFQGAAGGTINLSLNPSSSKKEFDDFRKLLTDQGEKLEPVAGLGDDAYYWGRRINVRVGNRAFTIWNGEPSQPVDKVKSDVLTLAKLTVPKLR